MPNKQSGSKQKLSSDDISRIVDKVDEGVVTPKEEVCDPKHDCDKDFGCNPPFHCLDKHDIVEDKK
ncbi:hypothetical protein KQH41_01600 [bacterium]|jgi:hypothetical protein|nr:hypothetical protein [bacterium]